MSTAEKVTGLINAARDQWEDERADGRQVITVCLDTSSLAAGVQSTLDSLRAEIAVSYTHLTLPTILLV